ncbi:Npun_R1517 family heterocyst differentiation transcriptional regulator [Leptolyngbya cf. ectocarpi LEGE 11479]|uniref:Npun_R1517 family heterocyst differentiation transcriptional regulator n=1 Tax=Leptolyngbya cf. ectocarpi LEGE 11479 TaxID=1828722 RepID=A0A928ZPV3_LEPEC|nr:Npun_R1517 family heterocyst differentiation transcriptional regulator [Leptolyngbya ectocarpi]MBE9065590.1 Npun_R1517 family heterocyst differentiation transcriptional regulator [Leptolyngbya cf. ectocarpi LEGE 11479]
MGTSFELSAQNDSVTIYECEVRLKFRLIEDKVTIDERDQSALIEALVDAYTYGDDEYLESLESQINVHEIQALDASPAMRRQLIRLRNSRKWA